MLLAEHARRSPRTPRRNPIYAIVRSGGKQYRVETDQVLDVDRLDVEVGATVELTDVLLLSESGTATVGTPTVADARVVAEVVEHGRDKKILVFKYKNKTRYRRRYGHRQDYTRLAIKQMGIGELEVAEAKPKRATKKKTKAEEAPSAGEGVAEQAADAVTTAEAKPAKPRARKAPVNATPVASQDQPEEAPTDDVVEPDAPEVAETVDAAAAEPEAKE